MLQTENEDHIVLLVQGEKQRQAQTIGPQRCEKCIVSFYILFILGLTLAIVLAMLKINNIIG